MNNDACIEMQVMDAIENATTDKHESSFLWLMRHGFVKGMDTQFVNQRFVVCGMPLAVMLEYNPENSCWACKGAMNDNELSVMVKQLVLKLLKCKNLTKSLLTSVNNHRILEFRPDMTRIGVMSLIFFNWLKTHSVSNHSNPEDALASYCRAVVPSIDAFRTECLKHTSEWWFGSYLSDMQLDSPQ